MEISHAEIIAVIVFLVGCGGVLVGAIKYLVEQNQKMIAASDAKNEKMHNECLEDKRELQAQIDAMIEHGSFSAARSVQRTERIQRNKSKESSGTLMPSALISRKAPTHLSVAIGIATTLFHR